MFVPGNYVPLSQFLHKGTSAITLQVDPSILNWVANRGATVWVMISTADGRAPVFVPTVVATSGAVTLANAIAGKVVVVCKLLRHDPDIVTHWNAVANGWKKGGQQLGARDALTRPIELATDGSLNPAPGYLSPNRTPSQPGYWGSLDPAVGRYEYASNSYALFSDGTGVHDHDVVPSLECYIGENWSTSGVSRLAAIRFSDSAREATGWPVAHRNHPFALQPGAAAGVGLERALPVFQVLHGHLIDVGPSTAAGSNDSLATYLLPPGWTDAAAANAFPILWNAFYDINDNTFRVSGLPFLRTMGALLRNPAGIRRAIGVLWNGGGAGAAFSFQPSFAAGAARTIADAASLLRGDPSRVVAIGRSRGGLSALRLACNENGHPYTVRFAVATAPQLRIGSNIATANPTFSLGMESLGFSTGFAEAWRTGWAEPGTGRTGRELSAWSLCGTSDFASIDANSAIDSTPMRTRLAAQGTCVILRNGTHDHAASCTQVIDYMHNLRALGVSTQLELYYRWGHNLPEPSAPSLTDLMNLVFQGNYTLANEERHFERDLLNYEIPVPIPPTSISHLPLTFVAPLQVGSTQPHTWSFTGQPGGRYRVRAARLAGWSLGQQLPTPFPPLQQVTIGTLSNGPVIGVATSQMNLQVVDGWWWYVVDYSWDGDAIWDVTLGQGNISAPSMPNQYPLVHIVAGEVKGLSDHDRTGGLAER